MKTELLSAEPGLLIHRAVLEPGEATVWHRDACRRFTVVITGRTTLEEVVTFFLESHDQVPQPSVDPRDGKANAP